MAAQPTGQVAGKLHAAEGAFQSDEDDDETSNEGSSKGSKIHNDDARTPARSVIRENECTSKY